MSSISSMSLVLCLAIFSFSTAHAAPEETAFPDTLHLKKDTNLGSDRLTYSGRIFNKITADRYMECQMTLVPFNKILLKEKPSKYPAGGTWETEHKNGMLPLYKGVSTYGDTELNGQVLESTYVRKDSQGVVSARINVKCGQVLYKDANVHVTPTFASDMPASFQKFYLGSGSKLIPPQSKTRSAQPAQGADY